MDWGTLVTRRASKEPPDKGGWNIFATGWVGADLLDPATKSAAQTNGEHAWFGWPSDDSLEALAHRLAQGEATLEERKKLAAKIQAARVRSGALYPDRDMGPKTAYRKNLKAVIQAPAFSDVERRKDLSALTPCPTM